MSEERSTEQIVSALTGNGKAIDDDNVNELCPTSASFTARRS